MKKYILLLILPIVFLATGCDDKADPFRNKSEYVKDAEVKPTAEDPIPGISPNAMDITLVRDLDTLYFEEGVEYSYEVNVRLYLPDIDFNAELVGAPEGMVLELKSEFNTEVVTSPVNPVDPVDPTVPAPPAAEGETEEEPPAPPSVANQKVYVIKWKPSFEAIPDPMIPSITRFLTFKVNIGEDKVRTREFRYSVSQATTKLKVTGFTVDPDLREGEKRGKAKVYVHYPSMQSTTKFPQVYFDLVGTTFQNACNHMPRAMVLDSGVNAVRYISDVNDPNYESIEYNYTLDLTRIDVTSNSITCNLNIYVTNLGNLSDPFPVSLTVLNTVADPKTDWADNIIKEFEQEKETAFTFEVYGVPNEGTIDMRFTKQCADVFNRQGNCKCRKYTSLSDRHRMTCLVEVNHKKTISAQTYVLEFEAWVSNGTMKSQVVKFRRSLKFHPKGFSFFDVDGTGGGEFKDESLSSDSDGTQEGAAASTSGEVDTSTTPLIPVTGSIDQL